MNTTTRHILKMFLTPFAVLLVLTSLIGAQFLAKNPTSAAVDAGTTVSVSIASVNAPPTITGLNPNEGPVDGGTVVTIYGTNFETTSSVTVGGASCISINIISPTSIQCTTTAHNTGVADITIVTAFGSDTLYGAFTFIDTSQPLPLPPSAGLLPPLTGLFTFGIFGEVTNYDIIALFIILLIIGVIIFLIACSGKKRGNTSKNKTSPKRQSNKTKRASATRKTVTKRR